MDPPGYTPWLNDTQLSALNTSFFEPGGCQEQEIACEALRNTDSANRTVDEVCIKADDFCVSSVGLIICLVLWVRFDVDIVVVSFVRSFVHIGRKRLRSRYR